MGESSGKETWEYAIIGTEHRAQGTEHRAQSTVETAHLLSHVNK